MCAPAISDKMTDAAASARWISGGRCLSTMEKEVNLLLVLHTLASGSDGNCLLASCGDTHLLVDAGISLRRIKAALARLSLTVDMLSGILITHSHSDHVSALQTLVKHHTVPIYASAGTGAQLCRRIAGLEPLLRTVSCGDIFSVGACRVTVFPTCHDTPDSVDYRLDTASGSAGILTDTGYVTEGARRALAGVDLLVLESNHDTDRLRSGPYPLPLKERIAGPNGHLSNTDAACFAVEMAHSGTDQIVLAHLSKENNTPRLALETMQQYLAQEQLDNVRVMIAPRCDLSDAYCTEGSPCKR